MQIVTILGDKELEAQVSKKLVPHIECNIINHENPEDFLSLCQIVPDVDALICDDTHVKELARTCIKNNLPLDFIYIGNQSFHIPDLNFHKISKEQNLLEYVKNNLNHKCVPITSDSEHRSIPIRYLYSVQKSPANFYYKVQKEAFAHYVKLINQNELISHKSLKTKQDKGLKELWIVKEDKPKLISFFNSIYLAILDKNNISNAYIDRDKIHNDIFELLTSIGLNDNSIKLAACAIKDLEENMEPSLIKAINKMLKVSGSFAYKKTYLTCIIISLFGKELSWITVNHLESLQLCAFFNDVFLTTPDMHSITSDFDLNNAASMSSKEIAIVEKHAEMASEWIEKQNAVPPETIRLIKQHHGSSNGIGFTTEFDKSITKLSQMFIVCEEFSDLLLNTSNNKPNIAAILKQIKEKFSTKTIHELTDALLMTIKKELNKS